MTNPYFIEATGCDDTTKVVMHLTDDEVKVARSIAAALTDKSSNGCQPDMTVVAARAIPNPEWDDDFYEPAGFDMFDDFYDRETNTLYKPEEN